MLPISSLALIPIALKTLAMVEKVKFLPFSIRRIENGKNLTFSTIARVFKAMGISAKLEIESKAKAKRSGVNRANFPAC
jgi:hypothetical protein